MHLGHDVPQVDRGPLTLYFRGLKGPNLRDIAEHLNLSRYTVIGSRAGSRWESVWLWQRIVTDLCSKYLAAQNLVAEDLGLTGGTDPQPRPSTLALPDAPFRNCRW